MHHSLCLTAEPIDEAALMLSRPPLQNDGAVLVFLGVVRELEGSEQLAALDYEAFRPMAEHQFNQLFGQAAERWPSLASVRLVHRLGRVVVGETSLWLEVIAPHRGEAFAAGQWLIDEMKRVVPIWKRTVSKPS
ncbi:MAG: molybdenum cofactor biosynthesis protein MoaE [Verrucomicrobia bacterium]|nr:molybdenum cofactor biosynthesis protein MoaE [Verrucomicrobiota bacterium]